jgi:hypothetical protein
MFRVWREQPRGPMGAATHGQRMCEDSLPPLLGRLPVVAVQVLPSDVRVTLMECQQGFHTTGRIGITPAVQPDAKCQDVAMNATQQFSH